MTTSEILSQLRCPQCRKPLQRAGSNTACAGHHTYPVIEDTPVLLIEDAAATMPLFRNSIAYAKKNTEPDGIYLDSLGISESEKLELLRLRTEKSAIDPVVSLLVAATNGIAYKHLIGRLTEYPIPDIRLPASQGASLLDIGCNWGRWSIAAAKKGYRVVGIDPSLGAVMAAKRTARTLSASAQFVVADGRYLPFADASFDVVFSYSVIQHFSKADAKTVFSEIGRVLKPGGRCLVQMPNVYGIRCLQHQLRRRFREGSGFEVRYWTPGELRRAFGERIGPASLSVDCFFGIGLQKSDLHLMTPLVKGAITVSELLRKLSLRAKFLTSVADSVYVESIKPL